MFLTRTLKSENKHRTICKKKAGKNRNETQEAVWARAFGRLKGLFAWRIGKLLSRQY